MFWSFHVPDSPCSLLLRRRNHASAARISSPAIATPTPIPAFAPVLSPPLDFADCVGVEDATEFAVGVAVGVGVEVELAAVEDVEDVDD
jgi:hypothetical protein